MSGNIVVHWTSSGILYEQPGSVDQALGPVLMRLETYDPGAVQRPRGTAAGAMLELPGRSLGATMRFVNHVLLSVLLIGCTGDPEDDTPGESGEETDETSRVWEAVEIHFDELSGNIDVSTQYADHVTFRATDGAAMHAFEFARFSRSPPYSAYTTRSAGGVGVRADLTLEFTTPVRQLQFYVLGDSQSGTIATMDITLENGDAATAEMVTDGTETTAELQDLTAWEGITRLTIRDMQDEYSVSYDDITFEAAQD